jgi:hypothetical protein
VNPPESSGLAPAIYQWDVANQMYSVTQVETVNEVATDYPATFTYRMVLTDAQKAMLEQKDYEAVLKILDFELTDDILLAIEQTGLSYMRGLALEALNRPDEALAEYVAIYEAAPESAWGMLARLHLERAEE